MDLCSGVGEEMDRLFDDNLRKSVANGLNTYFCIDLWLDGVHMSVRFPRLSL